MTNSLGRIDHICLRGEVDDYMSWTLSKDRVFSVKSCRGACWNGVETDGIWIHIWKLHIPSKVVFFLGTAIKARLPTMDLLQRRD